MYKKYPALYKADNDPEGFEWINADDGDRSIFSFMRKSPTKRNNLLFVVNFTPVERTNYKVGVPKKKQYKLIMDENELVEKPQISKAEAKEYNNRNFLSRIPLRLMDRRYLHIHSYKKAIPEENRNIFL